MRLKMFLLISILTASVSANAAGVWVQDQKIVSVWALASGDFVIKTESPADPVCQGSGVYFHVYVNQNALAAAGRANIYSAAMTAFATGGNVDIMYNNSSSSCFVSELRIKN